MGDATSLLRERNLVKDRGDESPARDAASEVGWRVLAENKSGNKCVEALINNQGHCTFQLASLAECHGATRASKGCVELHRFERSLA